MKVPAMKTNKGFTLIEMLVVISIIGILAAILLANLNSTRERARDATRQSDIKQYQTSLGQYASENTGLYPERFDVTDICDLQVQLDLPACIDDPQANSGIHYQYVSDVGAVNYAVWAQLENNVNQFWVLCSNGLVGETGTEPVPLPGVICPLSSP